MDKNSNFHKHVMYLVVQKEKKKALTFGPILQVAICPYTKGRGKVQQHLEALMFLSILEETGFSSIVVLLDNFDIEIASNFKDDVLIQEVSSVIDAKVFNVTWLQRYIEDHEDILLPIVQNMYKAKTGHEWKKPLRLKLKSLVLGSKSGTPTTSTA